MFLARVLNFKEVLARFTKLYIYQDMYITQRSKKNTLSSESFEPASLVTILRCHTKCVEKKNICGYNHDLDFFVNYHKEVA